MKFQFLAVPRVERKETQKSVRILRAARRLFIREGFAKFSARGVAKEARLSLGAVQHFYPTKHNLLAATLGYVVNQYDGGYQKLLRKLPGCGEARFLGILDYLLADIWNQNSRKFFFGFWALSSHNKFAAALLQEMYAYHVDRMSGFIAEANPMLAAERCHEISIQLVALLEGLLLFSPKPGKNLVSRAQMDRITRSTALAMIGLKPERP